MSRLALIAGMLGAVALGVWRLAPGGDEGGGDETGAPGLFAGVDLDTPGASHAVILHEEVTGSGWRVVRDSEVLRAAQGIARGAETQGAPLVSILRDKEVIATHRCPTQDCAGGGGVDLTALLAASLPLRHVLREFAHHEQARAAHFRALRDPDVIMIEPPNLPPPSDIVYAHRLHLTLPPQLIATDTAQEQPAPPFDEALFEARFAAALGYAYPDTEAYRLGRMSFTTVTPPQGGWPVVSDRAENQAKDHKPRDADGASLGLDGIMMIVPEVIVDLIPDLARRLRAPGAFAEMPDFNLRPQDLDTRLDALAREVLGHPCAGCFTLALPVADPDAIKVEERPPVRFTLSYYEVVPDEPAAQQ